MASKTFFACATFLFRFSEQSLHPIQLFFFLLKVEGIVIILLACVVTTITGLSMSAISTNGNIKGGKAEKCLANESFALFIIIAYYKYEMEFCHLTL